MTDETKAADSPRGPDEIRQDIDQTRDELAQTAAALAEKADVKARAHDKVEETKTRLTEKVSEVKDKAQSSTPPNVGEAASTAQATVKQNPVPAAVIGAFVAGFAVAWLLKKRR